MPLQFKQFILSVQDSIEGETRLNVFLRQHSILKVHREFVQDQQLALKQLFVRCALNSILQRLGEWFTHFSVNFNPHRVSVNQLKEC